MSARHFPPTPQPWEVTPADVRPSARDLWRDLLFYVPAWERGGIKPQDIVSGRVGEADDWGGDGGRLWTPDTERGHVLTADDATTQDIGFKWASFVPTHVVTCAILYRKTDTTARASGSFGISDAVGGSHRCGSHMPFSDGVIYWDFGGTGIGQRLTYNWGSDLGIDTDWHLWVFQQAPWYRAIWLDGVEKNSDTSGNARSPTGTQDSFYLFRHSNRASDLAQIGMFGMWNRILSAAEIEQLTADPHAPVRRSVRVPVAILAGEPAPEALTETASLEALIQQQDQLANSTLDAALQEQDRTVQATLEALLSATTTLTSSVDAALQATGLRRSATLEALLAELGLEVTASVDATLQELGLTQSSTLDAVLSTPAGQETATLDGLLRAIGVSRSSVLDARLRAQGLTREAAVDALLQAERSVGVSLDGLLFAADRKQSADLDAALQSLGLTDTATLDAILEQIADLTVQLGLDGVLRAIGRTRSVGLDAAIQDTSLSKSVAIDALLDKVVDLVAPRFPSELDRLELWTDLECAGGTRIGVFDEVTGIEERKAISEPSGLEFSIPMTDDLWGDIQEERVVRRVNKDGAYREWRIRQLAKEISEDGDREGTLVCDGPLQDLQLRSAMLERFEANGNGDQHFEYYQFTPEVLVGVALEGAPSYWQVGTIEATEPVDMIFHRDTSLSAIQEIAEIARFSDGHQGAEIRARRVSETGYAIDLLREVGSDAETLHIREARQLLEGSQKSDSEAVATRIYPRGGNTYAYEASMSRAQWEVGAQSGATLTMTDDIVGEAGQLDGLYVLDQDGNSYQISSSSAPDTIVLTSDPGVDLVGELLRFRRDVGNGVLGQVTYLESPSGVAEWGTKSQELERTDIPAIDNLVPDPFFLEWIGDLPRDVALVGSPNVARETNRLFNRAGDASLHVSALEGQGVERVPVSVIPTAERPFFVAQIQLWVVSGHVRLELIDVTNDQVFPPEDQEAVTVPTGTWIDSFGIAPGGDPEDNFFTRGTREFALRVVAEGGPAEWYLDAWMLLQQQSFSEEFYGGRASNDLWMLALDALDKVQAPEESYSVTPVDLFRLREEGQVEFEGDEIVLGGGTHVDASSVDIDFETRIVEVARNPQIEGATRVTLEKKTNDLTKLIHPASRRNRRKLDTQVGQEVPLKTDCTNLVDPTQAEDEKCSTDSAGRESFWTYPAIALAETAMEAGGTIGVGWDGKVSATGGEEVTEGGEGETSLDGELKRVVAGLIAREQFNRDSIGPDWTVHDGTFSIRFAAESLYCSEGGLIEWTALTPRGEQALQFIVRVNDMEEQNGEVYLRYDHNGGSPNGYLLRIGERLSGPSTGTRLLRLYLVEAGVETKIGEVAVDIDDGGPTQLIKFHVADGFQRVYMSEDPQGAVAPTLKLETNDTALDGTNGRVALGATDAAFNFCTFDDLAYCPHNRIDVTGLPTGYRVSTSEGAGPVTESGGEVFGFDIEGSYFFGSTLIVDDGGSPAEEQARLGGGIRGGDEFTYADVSGGETPQDDTSGFGLSALVGLSFRDSEGTELENTESKPGVKSTTYTRGQYTYTIPAGTVSIVPYGVRLGEAQGIACIQRVQVNQGNPCSFRLSEVVEAWRIPSDRDLVLDWALDEREPPRDMFDANGDCITDAQTQAEIILASRCWDRSGRDRHGMIYTWDFGVHAGRIPGAAYYGLGHPDPNTDWPSGVVALDAAPFVSVGDGSAPQDQEPVKDLSNYTVLGLFDPYMNEDGTWFINGMDIWGRFFNSDDTVEGVAYDAGGWWAWMGWNPNATDYQGPFIGFTADLGAATTEVIDTSVGPTQKSWFEIVWPFDWSFGLDIATLGADYAKLGKWIFIAQRVSTQADGTVNVDCYVGNLLSHKLHKLSPQMPWSVDNYPPVVSGIGFGGAVVTNTYGLPSFEEVESDAVKYCLASRALFGYDRDDCIMSSDGFIGGLDEHKYYARDLSDEEIRGSFLTIAGRRHTGDVLWSDPTDAEKAIIFDSNEHAK